MYQSLTKNIKTKALELGFSHVGLTKTEFLTEEGKRLNEWIQRGYNASMLWMEKNADKRIDPSKIIPTVKSILCVAMNYYTSIPHSQNEATGKISRYAWGEDYHSVMEKRLEELLLFIKSEIPDITGKIYVDTGPVMDKAWAVRSGIGWMGKHTNVITKQYGSWIFLGEILLDAELDYDMPMLDHCGTCTACIDACPTQAIVQPFLLDSNKCISYLTIEHSEDLPKNLVSKFQNWIYGCDICQDVCPWNRFQQETDEPAFKPNQENIAPPLIDLSEITYEQFNKRFRKSPVKRTKHRGLTRNARAVLESCKS